MIKFLFINLRYTWTKNTDLQGKVHRCPVFDSTCSLKLHVLLLSFHRYIGTVLSLAINIIKGN